MVLRLSPDSPFNYLRIDMFNAVIHETMSISGKRLPEHSLRPD